MKLSKATKYKIVQFLIDEFNPTFIYLFGSFAKGEGRNDSDIDLAIYTENIIDPYTLLMSASSLAFEVKREVQIVHLKDISTVFTAQVVGTKEVLYCNDEYKMANFDILAFKKYTRLNEERQIILDAIDEDGNIYG
ncbi:type II toxin-antitoxin system antitoxin [Alkalibacterium iburiense]|uniref:Type II toxin-antitoxin system antitoxin n=1 Tax=Alkalibacterium iburiense TaxID=290589 RepID=A0ABN0XSV9_9LACT